MANEMFNEKEDFILVLHNIDQVFLFFVVFLRTLPGLASKPKNFLFVLMLAL